MKQEATISSKQLRKVAPYIINIAMLIGLGTLAFGLVSCGGGGGGGAAGNTTMTITSIAPPGIVASSVAHTVYIYGTNLPTTGATISITNGSGTPTASIVSATANIITAQITIDTAPTNRYVTLTVQPTTGTSVSSILGVANVRVLYADILNKSYYPQCTGCHGSASTNPVMNLTGNANGLINAGSNCGSKKRVVRGDPRRASNVLIDKIQATSLSPACAGVPMPMGRTQLQPTEIQDFVEWIAGGAY